MSFHDIDIDRSLIFTMKFHKIHDIFHEILMKFHDIRRYWYSPLTYIHRASDSYSTGNFRSFDKLWQKYSDICNNMPFQ